MTRYRDGIDITQWTAAPPRIELSATLNTAVAAVFHSLSDPAMMCAVFPWMETVVVASTQSAPYGIGAVRTCTLVNGLVIEEEIIDWQPPHGYAYRGIEATHPFGMRGHIGVLSFEPIENGCEFTWQQRFNHANVPAMRTQLRQSMQSAMAHLVKRFGGHYEFKQGQMI